MKYAGDCKCGKCQLVPRALVERIYHTLNSTRAAAQQPSKVARLLRDMSDLLDDCSPTEDVGAYDGHHRWIQLATVREIREAADTLAAQPPAAPVEGDFYLVPREIIDQFPEINVNNYDHDDACALNAWGCEVVTNANPAPVQPSSAGTGDEELPEFEDPRVQIVYELMCDPDEPPNPEEHWEGWKSRRIVAALFRDLPQEVPHPDETVNFNGRLVTWAEIDAAVRKRNAALSRPELCSHEAIISLDGKWHCQKCGDAIEMATAYAHPSQLLGTENGR
jgi:hypothetical protein